MKKCPNCNSTKYRSNSQGGYCKNCGYENKRDAVTKSSNEESKTATENRKF
jgi:ribosomal protein L37AE/L43A